MPCEQCEDGKWRWGKTGECKYESREECERANNHKGSGMKLLDIVTGAWAIQPEKLTEIQDIYARHLKGEKIDISGIEAQIGQPLQNREQGYINVNGVAVIPIVGVIGKRMNLFTQISGGASTQLIERDFKDALLDPNVESILFEIDSPGGTVDGTSELGKIIYEARGKKPIVAWANGLMASAAYWIGSAADQIYISGDTTQVGSIGVLTRHVDYSKQDEMFGVNRTFIYAGKYKVVGADNKPLSKDDRAIIQEEIDYLYSIFVDTVAKHRGVDSATVIDNMAEGRIFTGQQAIDVNLVDGVSTLDALIAAMSDGVLPNPAEFQAGVLVGETGESMIAVPGAELEQSAKIESQPEQEKNSMSGNKEITKGYVLENHPDIAEAFREEGKATVDIENIETEAAKAERERIQGVLDQSMPGCEVMINEMAFDGKTTGPEAAVKILQVQKDKQNKAAADIHADGADIAGVTASASSGNVVESEAEAQIDDDAPIEERAKAEWDKSSATRKEFGGDFESYLAFRKANENGQVKLLKTGS